MNKTTQFKCPYFVPINEESRDREIAHGLDKVSIEYCEGAGTGVKCVYESNNKIVGCRRMKECPAYQEAKRKYLEEIQEKGEKNMGLTG